MVRLLLGSYRPDSYADPEIFASSLAIVLMGYDLEVCKAVVQPMGLPSRQTWPPSLAEVRQALDEEAQRRARIREAAEFRQRVAMAQTAAIEASSEAAQAERERREYMRRELVQRLRKRCPDAFGTNAGRVDQVAAVAKLRAMAQAAGVDLDAIPDAPSNWRAADATAPSRFR